jgi:hypothetical protein
MLEQALVRRGNSLVSVGCLAVPGDHLEAHIELKHHRLALLLMSDLLLIMANYTSRNLI